MTDGEGRSCTLDWKLYCYIPEPCLVWSDYPITTDPSAPGYDSEYDPGSVNFEVQGLMIKRLVDLRASVDGYEYSNGVLYYGWSARAMVLQS